MCMIDSCLYNEPIFFVGRLSAKIEVINNLLYERFVLNEKFCLFWLIFEMLSSSRDIIIKHIHTHADVRANIHHNELY